MILDTNNTREIFFGTGRVGITKTTTGFTVCIYEKDYSPVGDSTDEHAGVNTREAGFKSVCLRYDTHLSSNVSIEDEIKSIGILIEELNLVKENLERLREDNKRRQKC